MGESELHAPRDKVHAQLTDGHGRAVQVSPPDDHSAHKKVYVLDEKGRWWGSDRMLMGWISSHHYLQWVSMPPRSSALLCLFGHLV